MSSRRFLIEASFAACVALGGSAIGAERRPPPPSPKLTGCEYMGSGFIKLEGTETCIKVSGSVRVEVETSLPRADVFSASGH